MTQKLIYVLVVVAVLAGLYLTFGSQKSTNDDNSEVACTLEAMVCPDGTTVGRTGPNCEFAACPGVTDSGVPKDIQDHIDSKSDLIKLDEPDPLDIVTSPITIQGEARGYWFFEASFPVVLVNWDGLIIAEGIATAQDEWMTEEFVPFKAELEFTTDFTPDTPDFMKRGAIILQKDNPSGLPENDDALEVPIVFK